LGTLAEHHNILYSIEFGTLAEFHTAYLLISSALLSSASAFVATVGGGISSRAIRCPTTGWLQK
jgi:hypothetical protein